MSKAGPPLADRFACQLWLHVRAHGGTVGEVAKLMYLSDLSDATAAGVLRKIMRGERPLVRFGKADRFASVLGCDVSARFVEPALADLRVWRKWCAWESEDPS